MVVEPVGAAADDTRAARLLRAYDEALREEAEIVGAQSWDRDGPLLRAVFDDEFGFVSYRSLAGVDGPDGGHALDALIARTVEHFRDATDVSEVEWKTRGHDRPADLLDRLTRHGFDAQEPETVMIGEAELLAVDVPLPAGIRVRRLGVDALGRPQPVEVLRADLERSLALQLLVFGDPSHLSVDSLVRAAVERPDEVQHWVAEVVGPDGAGAEVVSAGRLERVPGTAFAGIWGGATAPPWRGRGIYRALTSARAAAALDLGVRYLQSDSTPDSRPILERAGLVAVTTTTPCVWRRTA